MQRRRVGRTARRLRLALGGLVAFSLWTLVVRIGLSDLISNPLDQLIRGPRLGLLGQFGAALGLLGTPAGTGVGVLGIALWMRRRN